MKKITEFPKSQRVESLRQMTKMLHELNVTGVLLGWQPYGYQKTQEETRENWNRIAEDDDLYTQAVFVYMLCSLEKYNLFL
jgi:hypothetical protein